MINVDFTDLKLNYLITHHIGNKLRDENITLSTELSSLEEDTKKILLKYFLLQVKTEEFYSFTHSVQLDMNEVFVLSKTIFKNNDSFIKNSQSIGKLLYEQSMHPKIKKGELNVAYFSGVALDDEVVDAIGIFKSETSAPYIKMHIEPSNYKINHDYGFELKGIDKGCIVFNSNVEDGFKVLVIDIANKAAEAQYWKDDFLKVKPISNEYHQTNQFLNIAKTFVTKQLSEEFDVSKGNKIEILNRSVEFFRTHNTFEMQAFENEVFEDESIKQSFRVFDQTYRGENEIELSGSFEISPKAVKKQSRALKSVLKLDKNFDIYIHNNNGLMQQGVDENGRKFYKIYYQTEH